MRIKSFYADSVEGAVALARRELGPDAMLVESRRAPLEARHLGHYEVVCAVVPEPVPENAAAQPSPEQDARLARELADLRKQLEVMGKTITRSAWSGAPAGADLADYHARLLAEDVESGLIQEMLDEVRRRQANAGASLEAMVATVIEKRILVDSALAAPAAGGTRIVALVGPPGAGKTTMIAKLAVTCGLTARRPLEMLSMDDYRVSGAEQLRSYATILGAGFQTLDTVSSLAQALQALQGKGLILIDTAGYGPRDMDRATDLARFLSSRTDISTHLVLTATMKPADLTRVAERFGIFRPASYVFTRLDETGTFGAEFSLSVRAGKPISMLSSGQEIPDDVEPATRARILNLLWPHTVCAARSAA
jgi:flagellar biosynthesis protein FlhF